MYDPAYVIQETDNARREEAAINRAPLRDRKEAQQAFYDAMATDPEIVGERLGYLLDGNYGAGPLFMAMQATKRMNRPAMFTQLVAVFEWNCPREMAVAAWKKLTPKQKATLQRTIEDAIQAFDNRPEYRRCSHDQRRT